MTDLAPRVPPAPFEITKEEQEALEALNEKYKTFVNIGGKLCEGDGKTACENGHEMDPKAVPSFMSGILKCDKCKSDLLKGDSYYVCHGENCNKRYHKGCTGYARLNRQETWTNSRFTYVGNFVDGLRHGKGECTYKDGSSYAG